MDYQSLNLKDCELKFASSEGVVSGYGAVFGNLDSKNDIIMPGAFDAVLKSGDPVDLYINHGWLRGELPVGRWSGLRQDTKGLLGDAGLIMQMPAAQNAYWAVKSGLASGFSIGFVPGEVERKNNGARIIHTVKLLKEISITTDPCNERAQITNVKFKEELDSAQTERDIERLLRDAGLSNWESKSIISRAKAIFSEREAPPEVPDPVMALALDKLQRLSQ
jgi:HK97 family phage prohead protease